MNLRTLYAHGMAEALNMTPHELYDWERAIKDDGQFSGTRSGPGGGTPATPQNVTLLLLAILGSSTKRNAGRRAKVFGIGATYIPPRGNSRADHYAASCPLTGQNTINDTLAVLLALPAKASDIDRIEFDAEVGAITIWQSFESEGETFTPCHRFATPAADEKEVPPIRTVRILSGKALRAIADAMQSGDDTDETN
jgi:hypothetical protein